MLKYFGPSIGITLLGLALATEWGGLQALLLVALLSIMEISLSFDNAVVNAAVLRHMSDVWQRRFLTWGILVAVFGMRLVLPVLIVAFASGLGIIQVAELAWFNPEEYSLHVTAAHVSVASFGGMFLLLVFLHFLCDESKERHWIGWVERRLISVGRLESSEIIIALLILLGLQWLAPIDSYTILLSGLVGIITYVVIKTIVAVVVGDDVDSLVVAIGRAGVMGFIYLEVLDMSFSLDGVVGAFAMSNDIILIMIGLGVGAFFVRSMTVYLVKKGTLDELIYLEHGAHWGIGSLAALMLTSIFIEVSHVLIGLVGVAFIGLSVVSSLKHRSIQHG